MAVDAEDQKAWESFLAGLPTATREMAEKLPPWGLYRIKGTGQICEICSYFDDLTIAVFAEHPVFGAVRVFGLALEDVEQIPAPALH